MNLSDVFIIYLACGAPVGVYFYLQNRRRISSSHLWLKTVLNFVFWIPLFVQIIQRSQILKSLFEKDSESNRYSSKLSDQIASAQKYLEKIILKSEINLSVYEFREVYERFVGLSLACQVRDKKPAAHEKEIFLVANHKNAEIGARCFHRRNQMRLSFHQTEAEKDFLQIIKLITSSVEDSSELHHSLKKLFIVLGNANAQSSLDELFVRARQIDEEISVRNLEKDLWKAEKHKPQTVRSISMNISTVGAKATSFTKD